jgi:hypothetical protein
MFMSEGAGTPLGGEYGNGAGGSGGGYGGGDGGYGGGGYGPGPMELGSPMKGEKRERSPDYDDDDGSDYDGACSFSISLFIPMLNLLLLESGGARGVTTKRRRGE